MPLFDTFHLEGANIYLWMLNETLDELVSACRNKGITPDDDAFTCKSVNRIREKIAERLLLQEIFHDNIRLNHDTNGAPVIDIPDTSLSISHTIGWLCIATTNGACTMGIDIEVFDKQVLRVRQKFLNADEMDWIPADDLTANLMAWTAKEALYKLFLGKGGASLCSHYSVGECVQVINCGYVVRPAKAACLPGEPLTVVSQVMSGAVLSLAVESRYIV